ncbi:TPA: hypothetical protein VCC33_000147 [Kluyvera cryocrescens]|nr:hypothetical protein [Kluyvera cryocrescens]
MDILDKSLTLYGYNFNGNIEYRVSTGSLVNIQNGRSVRLNGTSRLMLEYILSKEDGGFLRDDDIGFEFFDINGLKFSSSTLWHVMKNLEKKFNEIDSNIFFIKRHHGKGYYIDNNSFKRLFIG